MSKYINQKQLLMSLSDWQFGSQDDEHLWGVIEKVINAIESLPTIEVSEDCISREWLKENMLKYGFTAPDMTVTEFVEDAPSVVPSRAEGEWINKQEKYQMAECSNCKKVTMHEMWGDKLVYYDYCPNCGAKMKG